MLGYLGPEGSFSHQAAMQWSGSDNKELCQYSSMSALIAAVNNGDLDKAIIPIENSIEGSVTAAVDNLALYSDVFITGEYILKIKQNFIVKKGTKHEDIRLIVSHPQPLGQCARFLNSEFPEIKTETSSSTSAAAQTVSKSDGSIACIGSAEAARLYDLEIMYEDCADDRNNSTRFVIIEKNPSSIVTNHDKTSIAFTLENKPGTLYNVLKMFAESNINMIKIESRPVKDELGKYVFVVDIDGNIDDATIYFALDKLKRSTDFYKFLGSYQY